MATPSVDLAPDATGRGREADVLLWALRNPDEKGYAEQARWLLEQPLNWADLLRGAHRHGVLSGLYQFLRAFGRSAAPASLVDQLARFSDAQVPRDAVLIEETRRLSDAFGADGIPVLVLRAPRLLPRPGGDSLEHETEHLDMLVLGDIARAEAIATAQDYSPAESLNPAQAKAGRSVRGSSRFRHANGVLLQLHDRLASAYLPLNLDLDNVWKRRTSVRIPGQGDASFPSTEDLLLVLCVHGAAHFWERLAWIDDVARLVSSGGIDWSLATSLANEANAQRPFRLGLKLASDLLGAPVPADVLASADRDPRVQALAENVCQRVLQIRASRMTELARAGFRLRLLSGLAQQMRFGVTFALQPDLDDFRAISLPAPLFFLYHVVRPARLSSLLAARALKWRTRAPFVPTPLPVVERMLEMAELCASDVVFDLGCGDGRIVIEAAVRYGVRAVGVDLDPSLVERARANARAADMDHLVSFVRGDAMDVDISDATVVTLWTVPDLNLQLRPRLARDLRPGARVISHGFDMGDWAPDRAELVQNGEDFAMVYRWTIRNRVVEPTTPRLESGAG